VNAPIITDIKSAIIFGDSYLNIVDDILLITDYKNQDKGIHLFNKNTFEYIISTGRRGKGPGEIVRYGRMDTNNAERSFTVNDHGKKTMWKFYIDSILQKPNYLPHRLYNHNKDFFPGRYSFINDSVILGKAIKVINHYTFIEITAKFNLKSESTETFGYQHPIANDNKKSISNFGLSIANDIYVNAYYHNDLLTICNLKGELICNVVGPDWGKDIQDKKSYFHGIAFYKDKIITSFCGGDRFIFDEFKRPSGNLANCFLVFDNKGNYIQTIETGFHFNRFCIDEENNRVIVYFEDRDNPLGYFNLDIDEL
jgi:hypothetical protein